MSIRPVPECQELLFTSFLVAKRCRITVKDLCTLCRLNLALLFSAATPCTDRIGSHPPDFVWRGIKRFWQNSLIFLHQNNDTRYPINRDQSLSLPNERNVIKFKFSQETHYYLTLTSPNKKSSGSLDMACFGHHSKRK